MKCCNLYILQNCYINREKNFNKDMADCRDVQMDGVNPSCTKQSNKSEGWSIDTFFILEVIVMTPIILITIGLFLIPIILFALPPSNSISNNSSEVSCWYIL